MTTVLSLLTSAREAKAANVAVGSGPVESDAAER